MPCDANNLTKYEPHDLSGLDEPAEPTFLLPVQQQQPGLEFGWPVLVGETKGWVDGAGV